MKTRLRKRESRTEPPRLPARGENVALLRRGGERIQARIAERGEDELLVMLMVRTAQPLTEESLRDMVLELSDNESPAWLRGALTLEDDDLVRMREPQAIDTPQQREHVRVRYTRPVLIQASGEHSEISTFTVDISGGGMLLAGPGTLQRGDRIDFELNVSLEEEPIAGRGRVVREHPRGQRAIAFERIDEQERQRLIRFVFKCMREERNRGLK